MNRCYIGVGSNQKNPIRQLNLAINSLKSLPQSVFIKSSSFIWSEAWGMTSQQRFCNAVIAIETRLCPLLLLHYCQQIENKKGRVRKKHWGPRVIDIDILLYAHRKITNHKLVIPHPFMHERDFVMSPLKEIQRKTRISNANI